MFIQDLLLMLNKLWKQPSIFKVLHNSDTEFLIILMKIVGFLLLDYQ